MSTAQNSTKLHRRRYFEIVALKTLENIQENIYSSNLMKMHDCNLQPTTVKLKPPLQIFSESAQKRKNVLKFNFNKIDSKKKVSC